MHELNLNEGVKGMICILRGVTECLEKDVNKTPDFRIADDFLLNDKLAMSWQ